MRWRCNNTACRQGEFEAAAPVCPGCTVDARNPRYASIVTPLVTVHFDPPDRVVPSMGTGFLACDPARPVQGAVASGAHGAVNCAACRATEAFKQSWRAPTHAGSPADLVVNVEDGVLKEHPPG